MGTSRSPELIQQIADATSFSKMKEAKAESLDSVNSVLGKVSMESVFLLVYAHHTCWFCLFLLCVCFLFKPQKVARRAHSSMGIFIRARWQVHPAKHSPLSTPHQEQHGAAVRQTHPSKGTSVMHSVSVSVGIVYALVI